MGGIFRENLFLGFYLRIAKLKFSKTKKICLIVKTLSAKLKNFELGRRRKKKGFLKIFFEAIFCCLLCQIISNAETMEKNSVKFTVGYPSANNTSAKFANFWPFNRESKFCEISFSYDSILGTLTPLWYSSKFPLTRSINRMLSLNMTHVAAKIM